MSKEEYSHLLEYLDERFTSMDKRFDGLAKNMIAFGQEMTILISRVDQLEAK